MVASIDLVLEAAVLVSWSLTPLSYVEGLKWQQVRYSVCHMTISVLQSAIGSDGAGGGASRVRMFYTVIAVGPSPE